MTTTKRRTLTTLAATIAAAVLVLDQARHTTCPCGGCGGTR